MVLLPSRGGDIAFYPKHRRRFGRYMPTFLSQWIHRSRAAILRMIAGPYQPPIACGLRREQRLRSGDQVEIRPEIDDQKTIAPPLLEIPDHERLWTQDGSVEPIPCLRREHQVFAAQTQQIAM